MKVAINFLVMFFGFGFCVAQQKYQLPDLMQPQDLLVFQNKILILEDTTIYVFEMKHDKKNKHLKLLKSFGNKGKGPGEMETSPFNPNRLYLDGQSILVDSSNKLLYFDLNGEFLKEIRKPARLILQTLPVSGGFVTKELDRSDGRTEFITINLVSSSMEKIAELYRQPSPIQLTYGDMIADAVFVTANEDRIFIERSLEGICVDVFDHQGHKLKTVKKKMKPRIVTEMDKKEIMDAYKDDPLVKEIGFNNLKASVEFRFPETYPPVLEMRASNHILYLQTSFSDSKTTTYYALDLDSFNLNQLVLPTCQKGEDLAQTNGVGIRHFYFSTDSFFVLLEDEENETWHIQLIQL